MRDFPRGGIIGKAVYAARVYSRMRVSVYSAYVCFFMILSVFPLLLVLLGLLQNTALDARLLGNLLLGVLPRGLQERAQELIVIAYRKTASLGAVSFSALTALWSGSRGIYGLMIGLNAVYDTEETRGYLQTRLLCAVYTLAFLVVIALTLALHMFSRQLLSVLSGATHPLLRFLLQVVNQRFFVLVAVQTAVFTAMYKVLPSHRAGFWQCVPGALFASLGWLIFSNLYSVYVDNFAHLTNIYGSVYAVALYMLWLYFCVSIVLSGGALNRFLSEGI